MVSNQGALFDEPLRGPGLEVVVHRAALAASAADEALAALLAEVPWHQDHVVVAGRRSPVPRLECWVADAGCDYSYSGIRLERHDWWPTLLALRDLVERLAGHRCNAVLCNRYRDGSDAVAWHADDEPELGERPVIASLSLGASRRFQLRRVDDPSDRRELVLHHGDVVVMTGDTQARWRHRVPREAGVVGERINLTFRHIVGASELR